MVNPHFFFEGKLSREEAASALVATLIQQSSEFRWRFSNLLGICPEKNEQIDIAVERNEVDVFFTLPSANVSVIVEVKINSGAKTDGQLANYYTRCLAEYPDRRIVCVYLSTSRGLAKSEIDQLDLRPDDSSHSLTWSEIYQMADCLGDIDNEFVEEGLKTVAKMIERHNGTRYERSGDREFLYDTINLAHQAIEERNPPARTMMWKGKKTVEIYTCKRPVTSSVNICFETDGHGKVELPRENGHPVVDIIFRFQPAKKYSRKFDTSDWWSRTVEEGYAVNGKIFAFHEGWMVCQTRCCGTQGQIIKNIVSGFEPLLNDIESREIVGR